MSHMAHTKRPADVRGLPPLPAPNDRGIVEFPTSMGWASPERNAVALANITAVRVKPATGVSREAAENLVAELAWNWRFFRAEQRPTVTVESCAAQGFVVQVAFPPVGNPVVDQPMFVRTVGEWNGCYGGMGVVA